MLTLEQRKGAGKSPEHKHARLEFIKSNMELAIQAFINSNMDALYELRRLARSAGVYSKKTKQWYLDMGLRSYFNKAQQLPPLQPRVAPKKQTLLFIQQLSRKGKSIGYWVYVGKLIPQHGFKDPKICQFALDSYAKMHPNEAYRIHPADVFI